MSRIIKEFKVPDIDDFDLTDLENNPIVSFGYGYDLNDLCGKIVHISTRRKIINIEFTKLHPIYQIIKELDPALDLDLVYVATMNKKLAVSAVVKMVGKNNEAVSS